MFKNKVLNLLEKNKSVHINYVNIMYTKKKYFLNLVWIYKAYMAVLIL